VLRDDDEERLRDEREPERRVLDRLPDPVLPPEPLTFSCPRTPRVAPRAAPATTSPTFSAPATPSTAPRRSVSRVRGENTAAVIPATNADSVLIKSSSPKPTSFAI
jgi:hypothetical protein